MTDREAIERARRDYAWSPTMCRVCELAERGLDGVIEYKPVGTQRQLTLSDNDWRRLFAGLIFGCIEASTPVSAITAADELLTALREREAKP